MKMCGRQELNGADAIPLGTSEPTDPRLSMVRAMAAYEAATVELERGNIGEVVYILRSLSNEEHDLVEDMLLADDPPPIPPPATSWITDVRGQALVEFALVAPILLLVIVGGLMLGLAMFDRQSLTWQAQEGALAAALAGAEDSACDDARAAVAAVGGRSVASCDGRDGLTMDYAPAADPPTVRITLAGGTYPVPFLDAVTVSADATSVIRPPSATPAPSPLASASP